MRFLALSIYCVSLLLLATASPSPKNLKSNYAKKPSGAQDYNDIPESIRNHVLLRGFFNGREDGNDMIPQPTILKRKYKERSEISSSKASPLSSSSSVQVKSINDFENDTFQSAVEGLLTLANGHKNDDNSASSSSSTISAPAKRVRRDQPTLRAFSDTMYLKLSNVDFSRYFDARNQATTGKNYLIKCIIEGHNLKLATFLVSIGVRLDLEDSEVLEMISGSAIQEDSLVSKLILIELLEVDPLGTTRLFCAIKSDLADMFFLSMLIHSNKSVWTTVLPQIRETLHGCGHMEQSFSFVQEIHNPTEVIDLIAIEDEEAKSG
jgi:hypothetical protein